RHMVEVGGFRSLLNVSLRKENAFFGVLAIYRKEQRRFGAVAICVGICLAQSPVERGYWIRQRGQSARRRACVSMSAIRRLCAWRSDQPRAAPRTTWLRSQPRAALSGS